LVNTNHHQAANPEFIGEGLQPVAFTDDGVVEALESREDRFLLGAQWHPERMRDDGHRRKVFGAFIKAAEKYREEHKRGKTY
jgi:putative glutamine amidotransferase